MANHTRKSWGRPRKSWAYLPRGVYPAAQPQPRAAATPEQLARLRVLAEWYQALAAETREVAELVRTVVSCDCYQQILACGGEANRAGLQLQHELWFLEMRGKTEPPGGSA